MLGAMYKNILDPVLISLDSPLLCGPLYHHDIDRTGEFDCSMRTGTTALTYDNVHMHLGEARADPPQAQVLALAASSFSIAKLHLDLHGVLSILSQTQVSQIGCWVCRCSFLSGNFGILWTLADHARSI
jgi:hypothetical protein